MATPEPQALQLVVEICSTSKLSMPGHTKRGKLMEYFGRESPLSNMYCVLVLGERRPLTTGIVANPKGKTSVPLNEKLTFKYSGEPSIMVRLFAKPPSVDGRVVEADEDEKKDDALVGESELVFREGMDDLSPREEKVSIKCNGTVTGEVGLRVQLERSHTPVTSGLAITDDVLKTLSVMPLQWVTQMLLTLGVETDRLNSGETPLDILKSKLEDLEWQQCLRMDELHETEMLASKVQKIEKPQVFALQAVQWPWKGSAHRLSSSNPFSWSSLDESLVMPWVMKRKEIRDTCLAMAIDLDTVEDRCSGVAILASLSGVSSSGLQLAALASMTIPAAAGLKDFSTAIGIAATSTGLGEGLINFAKSHIQRSLAASHEQTVFHLIAQENAMHRKCWLAAKSWAWRKGGKAEVEELLKEAEKGNNHVIKQLQELFPEVDLDAFASKDGALRHVIEVKGFLVKATKIAKGVDGGSVAMNPIASALGAFRFPLKLKSLYAAAKDFTDGKPSAAGKRLREIAEKTSFKEDTPEEAVRNILAAPLNNISPAPSGVVMFDIKDTMLAIRMVMQKEGDEECTYHEQCTPVTLMPKTTYEVYFQVSTGIWLDVKERSEKGVWVNPPRTHTFSLDGSYDFRWFHVTGPWPPYVESAENEDGIMKSSA